MKLANDRAAIAVAVLNEFCDEVKPRGPWHWQCAVQNGTLLPFDVSFASGFLRLTTPLPTAEENTLTLSRAIARKGKQLGGGVKTVFNASCGEFSLCADLVVINEPQLLSRLNWALDGFHYGLRASVVACVDKADDHAHSTCTPQNALEDIMRETRWEWHTRGEGEYSVVLDAKSAPPAILRINEPGTEVSVEVARVNREARQSEHAIALYLLTSSFGMRMVCGAAAGTDAQQIFRLEARLPPAPDAEEVDHALSALSVAYRQSANEAIALLDETTAKSYLAVRNYSIALELDNREEN